ncbi:MAG: M50 family metallopeptidase [Alphaproteobacteria bacterium]|nr:M50 family metallopeptidase [Alphaproteobacteria bacterium]
MFDVFFSTVNAVLPGLLLLTVLVIVHEWGHWVFLRRYGVFVNQFSVGFGKALLSFTDKNGTEWRLSPIFLGGYVTFPYTFNDIPDRVKGKVDAQSVFNAKEPYQRAMVMLGGPLVNIVLSFLILVIFSFFCGTPSSTIVSPGSFEEIQVGDKLLSIENKAIDFANPEWCLRKMQNFSVERNGCTHEVHLKTETSLHEKAVSFDMQGAGTWGAVVYGGRVFYFGVKRMMGLLSLLFSGDISNLRGMPTIFKSATKRWSDGLAGFVLFSAMISLSLGIFNLLPIPALDGGHLLLLGISVIFRKGKPLPIFLEKIISYGFFGLLMAVILFVNIRDICQLESVQKLFA